MTEMPQYQRVVKSFYFSVPLYLLVPVLFWWGFLFFGLPTQGWLLALGAFGWFVALMLRGPIALLVKNLPRARATNLIASASGPLEEGVRFLLVLVWGSSLTSALSLGQGWAAIEVLFAVINGLVLVIMLKRTDEKALQVKVALQATGNLNQSPLWGVFERIFASMFHIGSTLLLAKSLWFVLIMIPLHTGLNLSVMHLMKRSVLQTELFIAGVGILVMTTAFYLIL